MLEKKMEQDINTVNQVMKTEGIPLSDQGKDAMRSAAKGCTSFENMFDKIIEAGKKETSKGTVK